VEVGFPGEDFRLTIRPNHKYAVARTTGSISPKRPGTNEATIFTNSTGKTNVPIWVAIPKQEILAVPIAHYSYHNKVKFMPVVSSLYIFMCVSALCFYFSFGHT